MLASLAAIEDTSSTSDSQSCDYGYDDLERLSGANCGSGWNQSFSYDAFGNQAKTASGGTQFNATFAIANNQIAEVGSYSPSYDANGNLLDDPVAGAAAYTWDADNHLHTVNGYTLVYDALGRVAEMQGGSSDAEVLYGPGGGKLALMNGSSLTEAFMPLPGGATAVYNSSGLAYYRHPDMLGSSRLASTPARAMYSSSTAYTPDGEPYGTAGTADPNFTGMNQDTAPGLYDFQYRELYSGLGRWLSPDPAGIAAVDPGSPQTWNRYAYVAGNMLTATDPLGLDCWNVSVQDSLGDSSSVTQCDPGSGGAGGGGGGGGDCVPAPLYMPRAGGNVNIRYECDDDGGGGGSGVGVGVLGSIGPDPTSPQPTSPPPVPQPPPRAQSLKNFVNCVSSGTDELNPANAIGLSDSNVAKGLLGGPASEVLSLVNGALTQAASGASVAALDTASQFLAAGSNPTITTYPYITTLTETPAVSSVTIPVKSIAGIATSFFETINPIAYAIDITTVGFVAVGCAAFN